MATVGTAAQGISAAIVYTAINRITEMMNTADAAMVAAVGSEVNPALQSVPNRPKTSDVFYSPEYSSASSALADANLEGEDLDIAPLPLFLDGVIGSFFEDYTGKLDHLFPGLGLAGADATAFAIAALQNATGMSYDELVDSADRKSVV